MGVGDPHSNYRCSVQGDMAPSPLFVQCLWQEHLRRGQTEEKDLVSAQRELGHHIQIVLWKRKWLSGLNVLLYVTLNVFPRCFIKESKILHFLTVGLLSLTTSKDQMLNPITPLDALAASDGCGLESFHSFNKILLNTYYVPITLLDTGNKNFIAIVFPYTKI